MFVRVTTMDDERISREGVTNGDHVTWSIIIWRLVKAGPLGRAVPCRARPADTSARAAAAAQCTQHMRPPHTPAHARTTHPRVAPATPCRPPEQSTRSRAARLRPPPPRPARTQPDRRSKVPSKLKRPSPHPFLSDWSKTITCKMIPPRRRYLKTGRCYLALLASGGATRPAGQLRHITT